VETLADLLDDYQAWRDSLPASLADNPIADRLDELLTLRDLVDQLAAAELNLVEGGRVILRDRVRRSGDVWPDRQSHEAGHCEERSDEAIAWGVGARNAPARSTQAELESAIATL